MSRYHCVDAQKAAGFPVTAACAAAGVSVSAYYAFTARRAPAAAAKQLEAELVSEIRAIHADSRGTYGSPRVYAELRRRGRAVNRKRVERLMRTHRIVGHRPRRRRGLTRPDAAAASAPDLVGRLFDPDRPDVAFLRRRDLRPHRRGLAVPGQRHRPGIPALARLVDGRPPRRRPGHRCAGRGGRRSWPSADARHDLPHRPRRRGRIQLVVATPRR